MGGRREVMCAIAGMAAHRLLSGQRSGRGGQRRGRGEGHPHGACHCRAHLLGAAGPLRCDAGAGLAPCPAPTLIANPPGTTALARRPHPHASHAPPLSEPALIRCTMSFCAWVAFPSLSAAKASATMLPAGARPGVGVEAQRGGGHGRGTDDGCLRCVMVLATWGCVRVGWGWGWGSDKEIHWEEQARRMMTGKSSKQLQAILLLRASGRLGHGRRQLQAEPSPTTVGPNASAAARHAWHPLLQPPHPAHVLWRSQLRCGPQHWAEARWQCRPSRLRRRWSYLPLPGDKRCSGARRVEGGEPVGIPSDPSFVGPQPSTRTSTRARAHTQAHTCNLSIYYLQGCQ